MDLYRSTDFTKLLSLSKSEIITHSFVRDIPLASGRTLALITLDNGAGHTRPNTLGVHTLIEMGERLDELTGRAESGEIDAVGIIGAQYIFAAGADLSQVNEIPDRETGLRMAQLGHHTFGKLSNLGVPSFAFLNGLALGGGVEIALNATYRTINSSLPALALPEVFLGIIPGWGGAWLLPNLIGITGALKVIIENPLKNNRTLTGSEAFHLGIADAMFSPPNFLENSLNWADRVLSGAIAPMRHNLPGALERTATWDIAIRTARKRLTERIGAVPLSPYRALDLLQAAKKTDKLTGFRAEDEALADLIAKDQFRASIYAFNLTQKHAKKPTGAPDPALAQKITKVGIIGAGLMATQFALLFVRRLRVPVLITDLDQQKVDRGVAQIHDAIDALRVRERIGSDEAKRLTALVSGTTSVKDFADCDWVIEAIFEELAAKQQVFADIEKHISPETILATNTSSLSVTQIGAKIAHPERLLGFHFFNPVAVMPLIEVVRTKKTSAAALATALAIAKALKKTPIVTADTPGFVVNRVLAKVLGEAMHAVETGNTFGDVVEATRPLGLPMDPFVLLDLVGLKVGAHVLDTHNAAFPERFFASAALHELAEAGVLLSKDSAGKVTGYHKKAVEIIRRHQIPGAALLTPDQLRTRLEDGLADEIHRMLGEGVVEDVQDIDLAMLLGAGWPFHMGGVTPYLDRVGASTRAFADSFHNPQIRGVRS